jgi:DNA-binding NtrC family response regulator
MTPRVLVVDDDPSVGVVLTALLTQEGFAAEHVSSGGAAVTALRAAAYDAVLTDLRMPGTDGMALLDVARREWPEIPVVMMTAHGTVPAAVEAMKRGAVDFLLKPFERDEVLATVRRALARTERTAARVTAAPARKATADAPSELLLPEGVGEWIAKVAPRNTTALLLGESGVGKEVIAQAIHAASAQAKGPFVAINCAALPETLIESELFGHEKGAFTGAATQKPGRVALADGGTLFLDEVGELPLPTQAKLLRLLEAREYYRVGGTAVSKTDARFLAATNRDLEAMVRAGTFREDLFFRLNVVALRLPALRERPGHAEQLAKVFGAEFGITDWEPEALALLGTYPWRGNVRELRNFVEGLSIFGSVDEAISAADVRMHATRLGVERGGSASAPPPRAPVDAAAPASSDLGGARRDAERTALVAALEKTRGNRSQAARILGISRRTLYNKLDEFGLGSAPSAL